MAIHINPSHAGDLHRALHVPAGEPISLSKLGAAKKRATRFGSTRLSKMVNFAMNAKRWNHSK